MGKEKSTFAADCPFREVMPDETRIREFQSAVVNWFRKNGKDYPWRRTRDPYAILVSELMLQQTRIQTVLERGYYENWMAKFPDWKTLADAKEQYVLKAWEGLGYYNRARNLQKSATKVVDEFGGMFPETIEDVLKLPGVGNYTAGAVLSFAFGKSHPIVDGNVIRVLARVFAWDTPVNTAFGKSKMWNWAEQLTPEDHVREYNSGIMELGQQVCHRGKPLCGNCPVSDWCLAGRSGNFDSFPVTGPGAKVTAKDEYVLLKTDSSGRKVWLVPETGSRRNGLWKLPEIPARDTTEMEEIFQIKYTITRYRVTLKVFRERDEGSYFCEHSDGKWVSLAEQDQFPPLGAPYLRVIEKASEL